MSFLYVVMHINKNVFTWKSLPSVWERYKSIAGGGGAAVADRRRYRARGWWCCVFAVIVWRSGWLCTQRWVFRRAAAPRLSFNYVAAIWIAMALNLEWAVPCRRLSSRFPKQCVFLKRMRCEGKRQCAILEQRKTWRHVWFCFFSFASLTHEIPCEAGVLHDMRIVK